METQAGRARRRRPRPLSTFCRFRKKRLVVPFQLNRVRVKRRRASCKNTTVLNHRHTAFFSHIEFVRSRALAGCESSNERKRNGSHSKAPTSWTRLVRRPKSPADLATSAPCSDGESASPPGTPWIHPEEVSVNCNTTSRCQASSPILSPLPYQTLIPLTPCNPGRYALSYLYGSGTRFMEPCCFLA